MMYHFVYKTTNVISGGYYIGKHTTDDLNDGYLGSGFGLKRAIEKHGKESFIREIVQFADSSAEAYELERVYLEDVWKNNKCYNRTNGGYGVGNGEGNPMYGKPITGDHRRKLSECKKGKKLKSLSEETKRKIRESKLGKARSEETKLKIKKTKTGVHHTEDHKEKIRAGKTGIKLTVEHRQSISEGHKRRFA